MTPGNETIPAITRRMARESAKASSTPTPHTRWSRRRGVLGVFAAFAAVAFVAASVSPMGAAFADADAAADAAADSATLYADAVDSAQTLDVDLDVERAGFDRDGYAVSLKPKPKAAASTSRAWAPPFVAPDPGTAKAIAYDMVKARGWSDGEYACLVALWKRESGWRVNAYNKSSGAYGIPQALPGKKMASAGSDWQTNPATQIKWGLRYVKGRYGTPCGAWAHSEKYGWY